MKIKAIDLKKYISKYLDSKINESWVGQDAMPMKPEDADLELDDISIIQPSTSRQVADTNLPVNDDDWCPQNLKELGMAMKQLAEHVPESQIKFLWGSLLKLVDKSIENTDTSLTAPKLKDMDIDGQQGKQL